MKHIKWLVPVFAFTLLVNANVFILQAQIQQAQTQTQNQSIAPTPSVHVFNNQQQLKPMELRFVTDPANSTLSPVVGFKLDTENVVTLTQGGNFKTALSPENDPNVKILKVTITDTDGGNLQELQQSSSDTNIWLLPQQIAPGNYLCNALVQFSDGQNGVFQIVCNIIIAGQAAQLQPLTSAQLAALNRDGQIINSINTIVKTTKVDPTPKPVPPPQFPRGTQVTTLADGTLLVIQPRGQTLVLPPIDGRPFTVVNNPNGTISIRSPGGTFVPVIPQSALAVAAPTDRPFCPTGRVCPIPDPPDCEKTPNNLMCPKPSQTPVPTCPTGYTYVTCLGCVKSPLNPPSPIERPPSLQLTNPPAKQCIPCIDPGCPNTTSQLPNLAQTCQGEYDEDTGECVPCDDDERYDPDETDPEDRCKDIDTGDNRRGGDGDNRRGGGDGEPTEVDPPEDPGTDGTGSFEPGTDGGEPSGGDGGFGGAS
jgi:hypothetical protein